LPPHGLDNMNIDEIQNQIRGQCNKIEPVYYPLFQPAVYEGRQILIIYAPGGDNRPYQAPDRTGARKVEKYYYIRSGSESVKATGEILNQLMQMTAKIPFDARRYVDPKLTIDVISPTLVRNFLSDIHSELVEIGVDIPDRELYKKLQLSLKINDHEAPRNFSLLFFVNEPDKYLRGARMEIAQFGEDVGGNTIEEKYLRGPIHHQIRQSLEYLNNLSQITVKKIPGIAEVSRTVAFPYEAMEEAIVNAFYHRSYDADYPDPVKVYLYPDRMEIISYPGPVPGINREQFTPEGFIPQVPNRNRRIGEFLKELNLAEGRGTGIPKIYKKMRENGSPLPKFDFDEKRTYFRVILPAHPQYIVIHALRESGRLWAIGERHEAVSNLEEALGKVPESGELVTQIIQYRIFMDDLTSAEKMFDRTKGKLAPASCHLPYIVMAKAYLDNDLPNKARNILINAPQPLRVDDRVELAILYKRTERLEEAHRIFYSTYHYIKDDPRAVHEYAQTKIKLAMSVYRRDMNSAKRLDREALELLHRVIQLTVDDVRKAWTWFDIARTLRWLHHPESEVKAAYKKAIGLLPHESRFKNWHDRYYKNRK